MTAPIQVLAIQRLEGPGSVKALVTCGSGA
jgi:hypothetical protein